MHVSWIGLTAAARSQEAMTDCWRWSSTSLLHGGCEPRTLRRRSDSDLASLFSSVNARFFTVHARVETHLSRAAAARFAVFGLCMMRQLKMEDGLCEILLRVAGWRGHAVGVRASGVDERINPG